MTDKPQPDALRLAEQYDYGDPAAHSNTWKVAVCTELRRQHAELETLRAKLKTYEDLGGAADDVQLLRMGYAAARLEIESLRGRGWVNLPGQLPEPGKPVLLDIGKKYPIRAMWAAKHTVEAGDDDTDWGEYDEATDTYYCPEGWYEWNEHEEVHWRVTGNAVSWCELPPSSAKGVAHG